MHTTAVAQNRNIFFDVHCVVSENIHATPTEGFAV